MNTTLIDDFESAVLAHDSLHTEVTRRHLDLSRARLFTAMCRTPNVPSARITEHWETSKIADFNAGWNECRVAMLSAQAAPRTNQCGETCERAKVCATCAGEIDGQAAPKVTCSTCNDNGAVGHPPDNYFPCPECAPSPEAKAQAVPEGWAVRVDWWGLWIVERGGEKFHLWAEKEARRLCELLNAAPQPPAPSEQELVYCKYCQGSGESTHVVGRGPDAHDEPCNCDKCGGTGVFQAGRIVDVGLLKYCGSGVAHIHARMTAYWSVLDAAWEALKKAGIRPDGNTSVAMAIERLSAPSEQRLSDLKILMLTTAYEQGVGKGRDGYRMDQNPYSKDGDEWSAWEFGRAEGVEQAERMKLAAPSEQRKPLLKLAAELSGVIIDCEESGGFDAECLATIKRVRNALNGIRSTGGEHE